MGTGSSTSSLRGVCSIAEAAGLGAASTQHHRVRRLAADMERGSQGTLGRAAVKSGPFGMVPGSSQFMCLGGSLKDECSQEMSCSALFLAQAGLL